MRPVVAHAAIPAQLTTMTAIDRIGFGMTSHFSISADTCHEKAVMSK